MCLAKESRARSLTLLHKYYDWQLIESLPLTALGELLSFTEKEEKRLEKEKAEKQLFPLWLANYALGKMQGSEVMSFEEFVNQTLSPSEPQEKQKKKKSAEDIMVEFMPLVEADRKKGG